MRISDWSSDVCSSDLLRKAKLNDLANIDDGPAFIDGPILVENAFVFENRNRLLDEFHSRKKIVLLIDETLFVIDKLGHISPSEKRGETKPAPAGSRNRALTCPEEITVSNGSPLGEIPGAAASGGFEGGTERKSTRLNSSH